VITWEIEFERLLDGVVLFDKSATDKESAIKAAYTLIEQGHDVRRVTAPDGTRVGAAAIAEAYLNRHRAGASAPALSRDPSPASTVDENIRPGELRGPNPAANIERPPRRQIWSLMSWQ
jgi:hypothetical protein